MAAPLEDAFFIQERLVFSAGLTVEVVTEQNLHAGTMVNPADSPEQGAFHDDEEYTLHPSTALPP
jgi:hypothetical protein